MIDFNKLMQSISAASHYPATLFSLGNAALSYYVAGPLGIMASITLVSVVFLVKIFENYSGRRVGVPFAILGIVNIFIALSIEVKIITDNKDILSVTPDVIASHIAAFAFLSWAIGHFLVSNYQNKNTKPKNAYKNPQVFYGVSDIISIHAAGVINWYALPVAILGFLKSLIIDWKPVFKSDTLNSFFIGITAARLYGLSYLIGAIFSTSVPAFAFAQFCWALAYFNFRKFF